VYGKEILAKKSEREGGGLDAYGKVQLTKRWGRVLY